MSDGASFGTRHRQEEVVQLSKGWNKVEQATQASAEARARAELSRLPQLFTTAVKVAKGGGPVIVRFLEQNEMVNVFDRHEYRVPDNRGGFFRRQFTCLREVNQECPGCAAGLKIKVRGVYNVIQRNRPVLRIGTDNRPIKGPDQRYIVDGYQDQVVILDVPSTTAEELRKKDASYHGLMNRDLMLSDSGSTFQPWSIEPADIDSGMVPMSENDQALAAKKHDLDAFMKPPSGPEAQQIVNQYGGNSGAVQQGQAGPPPVGPQGNGGNAQAANGFLAGAQVPAGMTGSAFGAAQQVATPAPVPAAPPAQLQPQTQQ